MMKRNIEHALSVAKYILQMRPVFNCAALFSDETENYVVPMEPEPGTDVTIRFRTARNNVDAVYLISGPMKREMNRCATIGSFDYYSTQIKVGVECFRYYFEILSGRSHCFYNKKGVTEDLSDRFAFRICPGFHTPAWSKGAVMYQILADRFCNGDPGNDVLTREYAYINGYAEKVEDWNRRPGTLDIRTFYGGDLEGVLSKLDYLQDLGVEVLYFNPLFVSPSNHKYDTQDYDHIDPHFGKIIADEGELLREHCMDNMQATRYISRVTRKENLEASNELFIRLVEECHRRGMRVILDGVFNHCGSFNKWMDRERLYECQPGYEKGAYVSQDSPYRSFFHFTNEHEWPYNPYYEGWWDHDTLPKLNYESSPKLEEYILKIAGKWVSPPYCADGWRLDVAADLGHSQQYNHEFWKKFREAVKTANPDAIILAEHYGDCMPWMNGDEWDTVMNYDAFMEPLTWFFTGMEKHSDSRNDSLLGNADAFVSAMQYHMAGFLAPSLFSAMNELSNHDHSRFLTRTNHTVGRMGDFDYDAASEGVNVSVMREAILMQMTWPGAPTIYYGDEAGLCGFTDPDNRRTYPWGSENTDLIDYYREAIRLHKSSPVFKGGSTLFLHGEQDILSYARFSADRTAVVIFNNGEEEHAVSIRVWPAGLENNQILTRVLYTDDNGWTTETERHPVTEGYLKIRLAAKCGMVLMTESPVQEMGREKDQEDSAV